MFVCETIQEARKKVCAWKKQGRSIGFVPTMGYLHDGHKSLIDRSVRENDETIVSVFVNPAQFAPNEDLDAYPRDFARDTALCEKAGAALLFHPAPEQMYPDGFSSFVDMTTLTGGLCGKTRPTHFRGVCTVLAKLFNIFAPDRAYFGEKDAQQFFVVRHMAKDLNFPIEVIGCPIVREQDGLALSSRNRYLSSDERDAALCLSKAVFCGKKRAKEGASVAQVIESMRKIVNDEPLARIDYIEAVRQDTLTPVETFEEPYLVALAVYIGKTRLIDNFMGGIQ